MRIYVTGAGGQLGRAVARALPSLHEVTAADHAQLDVTNGAVVERALAESQPEVVVHCAALTDTALCERGPLLAHEVNTLGAENVARACAAVGARLLAISTNEVFDGGKRSPYVEDDATRPINAYGRSKLAGEELAMRACADTLIVRTSWVYGEGERNFVAKVVAAAAREGRPLRFVTDEIAAPTRSEDLAEAIAALISRRAPAGVYHLTNEGEASRYDWAREIMRLAGIDTPVEAITTAELRASGYDGPAKPVYSLLANTRARALGVTLRPWREALAEHMQALQVAADG